MERYRKALLLAAEKQPIMRMTSEEFSLLPSMEFGVAYASMAVMNNNGILSILRRNAGVYAHILNFMIIARLQEPSSDLSSYHGNIQRGQDHYPPFPQNMMM